MNEKRKDTRWRIAIWIVVVIAAVVAALVAVPAFITSRNTASRDACIKNLQMIEAWQKADQKQVEFEPVKIVSATSALLPEFRTATTNANTSLHGSTESRANASSSAP